MRSSKQLMIVAFISAALRAVAIEPGDLLGTWRLLGATSTVIATGEKTNYLGSGSSGFLTYGKDGRMSAILTYGARPKPSDLTKLTDKERLPLYSTMLAYAGTFTLEGDTVTHHIDISSNETWTGTAQVRKVKFEGETLVITTPAQPRSKDGLVSVGELRWGRVKDSLPQMQRWSSFRPDQLFD